jgi:hypothetical protein
MYRDSVFIMLVGAEIVKCFRIMGTEIVKCCDEVGNEISVVFSESNKECRLGLR